MKSLVRAWVPEQLFDTLVGRVDQGGRAIYRLIRVFASVLLTLTLVSCATGVPLTELQPSLTPQSPEVGRIFFYRPSALGAMMRPYILLNGEPVGKATSRGFFYVDRPPGEYQVSISKVIGWVRDRRKVSVVLEKGQTRFVRISTSIGTIPIFTPYGLYMFTRVTVMDHEVGLSEIQKYKYTGGETSR